MTKYRSMLPFRVSVALQNFFHDKRSLSYILVDDRFHTVQDLQNHIENVFSIQQKISLTCNNHFLPSSEGVEIIKRDETIIVVPDDFNSLSSNINLEKNLRSTNEAQKQKHRSAICGDNELETHINRKRLTINHTAVDCEKQSNNDILYSNEYKTDNCARESEINLFSNIMSSDTGIENKFSLTEPEESFIDNHYISNIETPSSFRESIDDNVEFCTLRNIKQDDTTINSVNVKIIENKVVTDEQNKSVEKLSNEQSVINSWKTQNLSKMPVKSDNSEVTKTNIDDEKQKLFQPVVNEIKQIICERQTSNKDYKTHKDISPIKIYSVTKVINSNRSIDFHSSDDSSYKVTSSTLNTNDLENNCSANNISQNIDTKQCTNDEHNKILTIENHTSGIKKTEIINTSEDVTLKNDIFKTSEFTHQNDPSKFGVKYLPIETNSSSSDITEKTKFFNDFDNGLFVMKRVRKRKRKRNVTKEKNLIGDDCTESPSNKTFCYNFILNQSKQRTHIRFTDNDFLDSEMPMTLNEKKHIEENSSNCEKKLDHCNSFETVNENIKPDLKSILSKIDLTTKELDINVFKPINKEIVPAINDTVAFKIFQLNEVYEPYISDWIICTIKGVVMSMLEIEVLVGKINNEPKGKFYMEIEEINCETDHKNLQLNWTAMINPHLLT